MIYFNCSVFSVPNPNPNKYFRRYKCSFKRIDCTFMAFLNVCQRVDLDRLFKVEVGKIVNLDHGIKEFIIF